MTAIDDVLAIIPTLSETELIWFVLACLERARLPVEVLGSLSTSTVLEEAIGSARQSETLAAMKRQLPTKKLEELPEAQIDDSNDVQYYAMRALAPFHALSEGLDKLELVEVVGEVAATCWELWRDIDAHLHESAALDSHMEETELVEQLRVAKTASSLPDSRVKHVGTLPDTLMQGRKALKALINTYA